MAVAELVAVEDGCFKLQGDVNLYSVSSLGDIQLHGDMDRCVIDLSDVNNADSGVIALMLHWLRQTSAQDVKLLFTHIPEYLKSLIRLYDLEEIIPTD